MIIHAKKKKEKKPQLTMRNTTIKLDEYHEEDLREGKEDEDQNLG